MIHLRFMTARDVPLGMRLTEQAGWNQTEADWRRCLHLQPDGCFVAERAGIAVGTVTTCILGPIAWIALVLVDAAVRRQGIGRTLLDHALAFLDDCGVATVRLDATPLGRPLYEKRGFVEEYVLTRFEGIAPRLEAAAALRDKIALVSMRSEHQERVLRFDHQMMGTDRAELLRHLYVEAPAEWRLAMRGEQLLGFAAARAGRRAWQIGPCLANADAGPVLLLDALARRAGQHVFLDVPAENRLAAATVREAALVPQRPLYRMCRGPKPLEHVDYLWTSFGPEKG